MNQAETTAGVPIAELALRAWHDGRLLHGFLGRQGGVSRGAFATLNFSRFVGDSPAAVQANWTRLRRSMPDQIEIAELHQVHGNVVHAVERGCDGLRPTGDGLVTAAPGVVLAILTADCVPILMVDDEGTVAGAFHAGWRGALKSIAGAGVAAMVKLGAAPQRIQAALGPAIGACCFEVDRELAERFADELPGADRHRRPGQPGKALLDLKGIIGDQLIEAGLRPQAINSLGPCTRCASDRYFSRRANRGKITGLQLSYIGFKS